MASRVNRAEITVLHTVTVAAITSTRRGSPTEVDLDVEEGLERPCCANLCHVFTVAQTDLAGGLSLEPHARGFSIQVGRGFKPSLVGR